MTKLIYNYNQDGYYISTNQADIDPLESKRQGKDIYLLPKNATFEEVIAAKEDKLIKWNNNQWFYEDIIPEIKEEIIETIEEKIAKLKNIALINRKSYLSLTDWYILREYDQRDSYPEEVKENRILARFQINQIENISTLEKAESIEQDYIFNDHIGNIL